MPVYSVLEVNRIAAQTTGQRKQAHRTTVYSDPQRTAAARVCLSGKTKENRKKNPMAKQKPNKEQTSPFRYVRALLREHICRVFLRGLDGK